MLVHCSQGVSRSAALTIGYLMWKLGRPYQEVADLVKAIRGVTNPNIGFACQVGREPHCLPHRQWGTTACVGNI